MLEIGRCPRAEPEVCFKSLKGQFLRLENHCPSGTGKGKPDAFPIIIHPLKLGTLGPELKLGFLKKKNGFLMAEREERRAEMRSRSGEKTGEGGRGTRGPRSSWKWELEVELNSN